MDDRILCPHRQFDTILRAQRVSRHHTRRVICRVMRNLSGQE